jgi:hypothetical protein
MPSGSNVNGRFHRSFLSKRPREIPLKQFSRQRRRTVPFIRCVMPRIARMLHESRFRIYEMKASLTRPEINLSAVGLGRRLELIAVTQQASAREFREVDHWHRTVHQLLAVIPACHRSWPYPDRQD